MAARSVLGWSDSEFWEATPRRYLAHYNEYLVYVRNQTSQKPEPLLGKNAISDLQRIARSVV